MRKKASWQDKIDPAFDQIISLFLEIIEVVKLPANEGYIHISTEDPHFRLLEDEGFPDFKSYCESKKANNIIAELGSLIGGVEGGAMPSNDIKKLMEVFFALGLALSQRQTDIVDEHPGRPPDRPQFLESFICLMKS